MSYQGCYKDDRESRDLVHKTPPSATNSPQRCRAECDALSYSYAGLQVIIIIILIIFIIISTVTITTITIANL